MGELEGGAVIVGAAVFVTFTRIQGASTPSTQYWPESRIIETQQSFGVVPFICPQPLPPQKSHISEQQTVPFVSASPLRPLEQLDGTVPAIEPTKMYVGGIAWGVERNDGSSHAVIQELVVPCSN